MRIAQALAVASMLALPLSAQAEERLLEMEPQAGAVAAPIGVCSVLHEIYPSYCQYWHVIAVEVAALQPGASFVAENESSKQEFQVAWTGTNLYLDSGDVMLARGGGESSLSEVTELATKQTRRVTGWVDADKDGALSVGDTFAVDGKEAKIVELRGVVSVVAK
jgi:hypothetical protein